jgi:hypothetical protein
MQAHTFLIAASVAALGPQTLQPAALQPSDLFYRAALESSARDPDPALARSPGVAAVDQAARWRPAVEGKPEQAAPADSMAVQLASGSEPDADGLAGEPLLDPYATLDAPWNPYVEDLGPRPAAGSIDVPPGAASGWVWSGYRMAYLPPEGRVSHSAQYGYGNAGGDWAYTASAAQPVAYVSRYRAYAVPAALPDPARDAFVASGDYRAGAGREPAAVSTSGAGDYPDAGGFGFRGFGFPAAWSADGWDASGSSQAERGELRMGTFRWSWPWSTRGLWWSKRDEGPRPRDWASGLPRFRIGSFSFPDGWGRRGWLDDWEHGLGAWSDADSGCFGAGGGDDGLDRELGFRFGPFRLPARFADRLGSACPTDRRSRRADYCALDRHDAEPRRGSGADRSSGVVAGVDYPVEFALGGMGGAGPYAGSQDGIDDLDGRLRRIEHQLKVIIALLGRIGLGD